jgi:hypothetical protein
VTPSLALSRRRSPTAFGSPPHPQTGAESLDAKWRSSKAQQEHQQKHDKYVAHILMALSRWNLQDSSLKKWLAVQGGSNCEQRLRWLGAAAEEDDGSHRKD